MLKGTLLAAFITLVLFVIVRAFLPLIPLIFGLTDRSPEMESHQNLPRYSKDSPIIRTDIPGILLVKLSNFLSRALSEESLAYFHDLQSHWFESESKTMFWMKTFDFLILQRLITFVLDTTVSFPRSKRTN